MNALISIFASLIITPHLALGASSSGQQAIDYLGQVARHKVATTSVGGLRESNLGAVLSGLVRHKSGVNLSQQNVRILA